MGDKSVCFDCKKTFNRKFESGLNREYKCPNCGNQMTLLPHRFRPPKTTDKSKWDTVKFLVDNGFYYQHIYEHLENNNRINQPENYVEYPDNLRDAKEFVEKYKTQARK